MPAGKTHLAIELFLFPFALGLFYFTLSSQWNDICLFGASYLVASLWFSPDLDLRSNLSRRRWGLFGWIWAPYTGIFKHRGLSHHIIIGPLTRLIYVAFLAWGSISLLVFMGFPRPEGVERWISNQSLMVLLLGIYLPNAIHVIADGLSHLSLQVRKNQK